MDDLKKKSDEELRDIMRASIANAYVPSSIYHRAKLELEFRTRSNINFFLNDSNLSIGSNDISQSTKRDNLQTSESLEDSSGILLIGRHSYKKFGIRPLSPAKKSRRGWYFSDDGSAG